MTMHVIDDEITSDITTHHATRCPGGWAVTWLGDRTVAYSGALTAMTIAEETLTASWGDLLSDATLKSCRMIDGLARELGLTGEQAINMVRETLPPTVTHDSHAIPADDEAAAALARLGDAYAEPTKPIVLRDPSETELGDWERELLASTPHAKTHDLTVDRRNGNVVIAVESETDVHRAYLQEGVARDLGYALAPLTPAQRQLLIDDLTGGEK